MAKAAKDWETAFDFASDFSSRVTVGTIFALLGLSDRDPAQMRHRVVLSISTDKQARGRNAELDAAFAELTRFLADEIAERRARRADDLITALAAVGSPCWSRRSPTKRSSD